MKKSEAKLSKYVKDMIKENRLMLLILRDRIRHDKKISDTDKTKILNMFSDCFDPDKLNNLGIRNK